VNQARTGSWKTSSTGCGVPLRTEPGLEPWIISVFGLAHRNRKPLTYQASSL
jgi:hypothetical protein